MTRTVKAQSDRYKCPWCRNRCSRVAAFNSGFLRSDTKDEPEYKCPACGSELLLPTEGSTNWRKPESVSK